MTPRQIAAKARRSEYPINVIAEAYGVKIKQTWSVTATKIGNPDFIEGPNGGGVDPFARVLFTEDTLDVEDNLHEFVHVICAIPFIGDDGIEDVPEESVLFMFERALAEACLTYHDVQRVIDYQLLTSLSKYNRCELGALVQDRPNAVRGLWTTGLRRCRIVGLLDEDNFPTFRWPDWSRLSRRSIANVVRVPALVDAW